MTRYEAYVANDWKEMGMTNLVVARMRSDGPVEFAVFLVDLLCLGIKDAIHETDLTETELRDFIETRLPQEMRLPLHPACAKKMIDGAIAYAASLGFAPHRDYRKAKRILSGLDAATCTEKFAYGEKGHPCYVRGPDDSEERVDRILAMLEAKCGIDGFTFVDLPGEGGADEEDDADGLAAREDLMNWLEDEADEVPRFYEVSGLITAMQLCPEALSPALLVNVLWPDKPGLANLEEAQDFMSILQDYWNEIVRMVADTVDPQAPPEATCIDVALEDFDDDDSAGMMMAMRDWAAGFVRSTIIWPEAWGDAVGRTDLAPHWEVIRCYAKLEKSGSLKRLDQMQTEKPPRTLNGAVTALARALRPPFAVPY